MERDHRSTVGTFFIDEPLVSTRSVELSERANQHARVKRIEDGNVVRLIDGTGVLAIGRIASLKRGMYLVNVEHVEPVSRPRSVHLRVPMGDRDRMLWLAEKATELGVESWQAVMYRRSRSVMPRGEGPAFANKVRARMISALEQSGRAWLPMILADATIETMDEPPDATKIVLDPDGDAIGQVDGKSAYAVTFGPEGGLEPSERSALVERRWRPTRLADGILRFETAGIAAMSVIRAAQIPRGGSRG